MSMVMFKGDKVVCIDNGGMRKRLVCIDNSGMCKNVVSKEVLTLHKVYECIGPGGIYVSVINNFGNVGEYFGERFITLSEFRRMKLLKLGMSL